MKNLKIKIAAAGAVALLATLCALAQSATEKTPEATAQPDAGNLRAFVELARSDIKTQKATLIAENLPLTEEEGAEFWPLHHDYESELSKLSDQKVALIQRYAKGYQSMTDTEATELAKTTFDLEEKRTALKRTYFKKFSKVIPATKAARFFQIENQLTMVLDLQVAAALPLIK